MLSIRRLTELSALATGAVPPNEAVERVLPLLQEGLGAEDVYLVYGGDGTFLRFGSSPDLELSDVAVWLVVQHLASRSGPCAFDLDDCRVSGFRDIGERRPCRYIAAPVPMPSPAGETVVARGSWPRGLGVHQLRFLQAALPSLALLLERRLDASRAERQQNQLTALANITRVMSESEDLEQVLTSIACTIATVTGINYVSIDIVNSEGKVALRCVNLSPREELAERWKRGASRPDPVRDEVLQTRKPMLFPDAQKDERIPESGRNYFMRTLLQSTAVFPLLAKDEALGVVSFASHRPQTFSPRQVELLEGLTAQVATAVKGIRLYQELAESRQELQRLNEQLRENMSIQHHLARTDALTGIPNRRSIDEAIEAEYARAQRYGQTLSVVLADLDHLKTINDASGHGAGDEAIRFAAGVARSTCRQMDMVGRYGGDEYVFLLPNTSSQDAALFAERFRQRLAEIPLSLRGGLPIHLTISLGVAQWEAATMDGPACLVHQADRAMYAAKAAGRNRTMVAAGETARAA